MAGSHLAHIWLTSQSEPPSTHIPPVLTADTQRHYGSPSTTLRLTLNDITAHPRRHYGSPPPPYTSLRNSLSRLKSLKSHVNSKILLATIYLILSCLYNHQLNLLVIMLGKLLGNIKIFRAGKLMCTCPCVLVPKLQWTLPPWRI